MFRGGNFSVLISVSVRLQQSFFSLNRLLGCHSDTFPVWSLKKLIRNPEKSVCTVKKSGFSNPLPELQSPGFLFTRLINLITAESQL